MQASISGSRYGQWTDYGEGERAICRVLLFCRDGYIAALQIPLLPVTIRRVFFLAQMGPPLTMQLN